MGTFRRRFQGEIPQEVAVALSRALALVRDVQVLSAEFGKSDEFAPIVPLVQIPLECRGTTFRVPGFHAGWDVQAHFVGPVRMSLKIGWTHISAPHLYSVVVFWQTSGRHPFRSLFLEEAQLCALAPDRPADEKRAVLDRVRRHDALPMMAAP